MDYKFYYSNNNGQDDYGLKGVTENGYGLKCTSFQLKYPPQEQEVQPSTHPSRLSWGDSQCAKRLNRAVPPFPTRECERGV